MMVVFEWKKLCVYLYKLLGIVGHANVSLNSHFLNVQLKSETVNYLVSDWFNLKHTHKYGQ